MNRKLIAVAVGGALALPTLAVAQSTVQIYGRAHTEYAYTDQGGTHEDQMQNGGGSNIGFRGTESLGGGMTAWFQCESGIQVQSGANGDGFCTRNSAVGIRGAFGNVHYGHWDLPMKWATISGVKHADTGVFGVASLFHKGAPAGNQQGGFPGADGTNVTIVPAATVVTGSGNVNPATITRNTATHNQSLTTFYRRQSNTVQYWTPVMGGFEGRASWTATNEKTATNGLTPRTWSLAGKYANGPLLLALGYEKHQDYVLAGRDDTGWIAAASYQFGPVRLAAMYEKLEWESFHATNTGKTDSWGFFVDWRIAGPHSVQFQYVQADDTEGSLTAGNTGYSGSSLTTVAAPSPGQTATGQISQGTGSFLTFNGGAGGTGAKQYGVRYTYSFSKRTDVRLAYTLIDNDDNARYGSYTTGATAPLLGERVSAWGLAIDHRF